MTRLSQVPSRAHTGQTGANDHNMHAGMSGKLVGIDMVGNRKSAENQDGSARKLRLVPTRVAWNEFGGGSFLQTVKSYKQLRNK
jgi:hypothetical protein